MIAKQYCQTESTLGYAATQEKKKKKEKKRRDRGETLSLPFTSMHGAVHRGETVQELMIAYI